nr:5024_t:CDS:2 [Entrophospora candida]
MEAISDKVKSFWNKNEEADKYEAAKLTEMKKIEFLKVCNATETYQRGHKHLIRTPAIVSNINLCMLENSIEPDKSNINTEELEEIYEPEPDNKKSTEELVINYNSHPNLNAYCKILESLQNHHIEENLQCAQHFIKMLKWSCVDYELFLATEWEGKSQSSSFSIP